MKQASRERDISATKILRLFFVGAFFIASINSVSASYDSFLFGPDEKILLWPEPLEPSDLGLTNLNSTGLVAKLNQYLIDQYLARDTLSKSSVLPQIIKQQYKLSLQAEKDLLTKFSNFRLARSEKILQLSSLVHLNRLGAARENITDLALLQRQFLPDSIKVSNGKGKTSRKLHRQKLSFVTAYNEVSNLAKELYGSEPENSRYLSMALGSLLNSDSRLKIVNLKNTAHQSESSEAEKLYAEGVAALTQGLYEIAEVKLRQAQQIYDKLQTRQLVQARETNLALAHTLTGLDRRDEALQHFSSVIEDLKKTARPSRPQTDTLVEEFVRLATTDLAELSVPPAENYVIANGLKEKVVHSLHALVAAAYLCKIDGKLPEAAQLFRRAYLINKYYFPELDDLRSSVCYDLGETLFWSGSFDEAEHYMTEALKLREKTGRQTSTALDTRSTLGRILISGERGEFARRFYLETLQLLAVRESGESLASVQANSFVQLTDKLFIIFSKADASAAQTSIFRRQLDDALQGFADAAISSKRYNEATESDAVLLKLREKEGNKDQIMATLWQMAWVAQMSNRSSDSTQLYTRLLNQFPDTADRQRADWYQSRAIDLDLLGKYKEASCDFKHARKLFKKCLLLESDPEEIDKLSWTIDDIDYNLLSRRKSPPSARDYLKSEPNNFWRKQRFPLKVFVETSTTGGFGGELKQLMLNAMSVWTDFAQSPVKLQFVDNAHDADVYIERVTSYDDIPYSSAGRTSITYENGDAESRVIDRAHVRVYCPSYDGHASDTNGADKIVNQEMSPFAKTHLYTLFMHEFGHVIGVGHSPAGEDVMYWKSCSAHLSERDCETIRQLYRKAANNL